MSQDTATIAVISAPPIDSLKELRRQNSALLQRSVAGEGESKPTEGELLGFLESASKLGRSLEDEDERETAQGIMDVWIAALLNLNPDAGNVSRPFTLEDLDESSAKLVANEARQQRVEAVAAARRADALLPASPEANVSRVKLSWAHDWVPRCLKPYAMTLAGRNSEASVLQRLLMRFIRLKEKSVDAYAVPLASNDEVFTEPKAQIVLDQLIEAGVIKAQEAPNAAIPSYVLAHDTLLTQWPVLVEIVTQRRAFRQLARGWDSGGRQRAALLSSGQQLQEALDYPQVDELESAFIENSRRAGESYRRLLLTVAGVVMAALFGMVCTLYVQNRKLIRALNAEKKAIDSLNESINHLKQANLDTQQKAALASVSQSKLYSLRDLIFVPKEGNRAPKFASDWVWPDPLNFAISPARAPRIQSILTGITPQEPTPGFPQMEFFVPVSISEPAFVKALEKQIAFMACPPAPGQHVFEFPARTPLPRFSGPALFTEVRYFHAGDDPAKDADAPLAQEVMARLIASGFSKPIKIAPNKDHTAPRFFIQVAFALGAFD